MWVRVPFFFFFGLLEGGSWLEVFKFFICFSWSDGLSVTSRSYEAVSPDHQMTGLWAVYIHRSDCNGTPDISWLVCARWLDLWLFSLGSSWVALQLISSVALQLISSFSTKVGQFSFVQCPKANEISLVICHVPALGYWLVAPPPLLAFVSHCLSLLNLASCPTPVLQGWFSVPPCPRWVVD
jgi:hypothetical protein